MHQNAASCGNGLSLSRRNFTCNKLLTMPHHSHILHKGVSFITKLHKTACSWFEGTAIVTMLHNSEGQHTGISRSRDTLYQLNCLPDHKILAMSKLKAFADDNFNLAQMASL